MFVIAGGMAPYEGPTAHRAHVLISLALVTATSFAAAEPLAPDSPLASLLEGRISLHMRYRYEHVDDDLVPAHAATPASRRMPRAIG